VTGCRPNNHCLILTFPPYQPLDPPPHLSTRGVRTCSQRLKPSASRKGLIFKFQLCCNLPKSYTIPVVVLTWRERTFTLFEHAYSVGNFLVLLKKPETATYMSVCQKCTVKQGTRTENWNSWKYSISDGQEKKIQEVYKFYKPVYYKGESKILAL